MTEPERRRRRPAVSCLRCKRSKIKCNRESPCGNCARAKGAPSCIYQDHSEPARRLVGQGQAVSTQSQQVCIPENKASSPYNELSSFSRSAVASSTNASTPASQPSILDFESLQRRIRDLEQQLSEAGPMSIQPPLKLNSVIETSTSQIGGTIHVHRQSPALGKPHTISRSVTHKSRTFGQSHWINSFSLFQDIPHMIEPHREDASKIYAGIQKCKSLSKTIKSHRAPPWPCPPTIDLPPKNVADELVDCYLRTSEMIYRILHIPTFKESYDDLWDIGKEPDQAFLVQVKLIFAIGAIIFDEHFSFRTAALRWVYEAQTWLAGPNFKSRLDLHSIQTELLLLLARDLVSGGGEPVWISAGSLVRKAVHMGLHRDPSNLPFKPKLGAEMHRRLWNTILEIGLQSSLTSGGPPNISLDDFDTEPPGNLDDEHITDQVTLPNREDTFTQSSIAIALRKTFSIRLAVTKHLNDLKSQVTYEETLRLDAELRASYKILSRSLQRYNSKTAFSPSKFEIRFVDFIMHRYLSALHIPFFGPALQETSYAYSRKVVIDTAFKTWCAANPSSAILTAQSQGNPNSCDVDDFARLVTCGSGFSRTVAMQSAILIAVELKTQLEEDESLGPVLLRPDLFSVLDDAKTWCLRCIKAGEISIKGYLLMSVLTAQVKGLMQGIGTDEIPTLVISAAEDAEETCLPILEEMAARRNGSELEETTSDTPLEVMEDWDFMLADPMAWDFNDAGIQEPPQW